MRTINENNPPFAACVRPLANHTAQAHRPGPAADATRAAVCHVYR